MVLLFLYSPAAVFAANSFTLHLSGKAAERGGSITLSGTTAGPGDQVVVKIVSPAGTVFYIDVLKAVDGAYAQRLSIPASQLLAPSGSYNVVAGSGGAALTQEFTIQGRIIRAPEHRLQLQQQPQARCRLQLQHRHRHRRRIPELRVIRVRHSPLERAALLHQRPAQYQPEPEKPLMPGSSQS